MELEQTIGSAKFSQRLGCAACTVSADSSKARGQAVGPVPRRDAFGHVGEEQLLDHPLLVGVDLQRGQLELEERVLTGLVQPQDVFRGGTITLARFTLQPPGRSPWHLLVPCHASRPAQGDVPWAGTAPWVGTTQLATRHSDPPNECVPRSVSPFDRKTAPFQETSRHAPWATPGELNLNWGDCPDRVA